MSPARVEPPGAAPQAGTAALPPWPPALVLLEPGAVSEQALAAPRLSMQARIGARRGGPSGLGAAATRAAAVLQAAAAPVPLLAGWTGFGVAIKANTNRMAPPLSCHQCARIYSGGSAGAVLVVSAAGTSRASRGGVLEGTWERPFGAVGASVCAKIWGQQAKGARRRWSRRRMH